MNNYEIPTGYAETMEKLKRPGSWDVLGVIADIAEDLRRSTDCGPALAVIDTLCFRMKDIAELISHGHAKVIDAGTVRKAAEIAAMFVKRDPAHEDLLRFVKSFLSPEENGHAVPAHIRDKARIVLGLQPVETTSGNT